MRRKYYNKEGDCDKCHHRRPQFLISLTKCNLSDSYQQRDQYDNTVSTVATIVTRRFKNRNILEIVLYVF
jgi:hypothetical protein